MRTDACPCHACLSVAEQACPWDLPRAGLLGSVAKKLRLYEFPRPYHGPFFAAFHGGGRFSAPGGRTACRDAAPYSHFHALYEFSGCGHGSPDARNTPHEGHTLLSGGPAACGAAAAVPCGLPPVHAPVCAGGLSAGGGAVGVMAAVFSLMVGANTALILVANIATSLLLPASLPAVLSATDAGLRLLGLEPLNMPRIWNLGT